MYERVCSDLVAYEQAEQRCETALSCLNNRPGDGTNKTSKPKQHGSFRSTQTRPCDRTRVDLLDFIWCCVLMLSDLIWGTASFWGCLHIIARAVRRWSNSTNLGLLPSTHRRSDTQTGLRWLGISVSNKRTVVALRDVRLTVTSTSFNQHQDTLALYLKSGLGRRTVKMFYDVGAAAATCVTLASPLLLGFIIVMLAKSSAKQVNSDPTSHSTLLKRLDTETSAPELASNLQGIQVLVSSHLTYILPQQRADFNLGARPHSTSISSPDHRTCPLHLSNHARSWAWRCSCNVSRVLTQYRSRLSYHLTATIFHYYLWASRYFGSYRVLSYRFHLLTWPICRNGRESGLQRLVPGIISCFGGSFGWRLLLVF